MGGSGRCFPPHPPLIEPGIAMACGERPATGSSCRLPERRPPRLQRGKIHFPHALTAPSYTRHAAALCILLEAAPREGPPLVNARVTPLAPIQARRATTFGVCLPSSTMRTTARPTQQNRFLFV